MINKIVLKHFKISLGIYEIAAIAIILFATALRIVLTYYGWPPTDSDEGTMGIAALHITYNGAFPIFFYGQGYMGTLEAYIAAPFFRLFGPSVFSLRLGTIAMFAGFLLSMYLLASMLYTKKVALITIGLLSLGSAEMIVRQLEAAGGYPETLLFGTLLFLFACRLAFGAGWALVGARHEAQPPSPLRTDERVSETPTFESPQRDLSKGERRRRIIAYGLWGFLAGFAIWCDLLVFPFILMGGLLLWRFCRKEMSRAGLLILLLGFLITLVPWIVYNLKVPDINRSTLFVLDIIFRVNGNGQLLSQPTFEAKIAGALLVSLPLITGASTLCALSLPQAWPLSAHSSAHTIQCTVVYGAWGSGFIVLWVIAFFLAALAYWRLRHPSSPQAELQSQSFETRRETIRQYARLALLGSAGLILVVYALTAAAGQTPGASSRYLLALFVAAPAVLSPLVESGGRIKSALRGFAPVWMAFRYGIVLLIGITFLLGTIGILSLLPAAQARSQQQSALVSNLLRVGATRIYSDYWTCDRVIFQSQERIICSVVGDHLQPGYDRYLPYRSILAADPDASYVFLVASPQAVTFAQKMALSRQHYRRFVFDGYVIYQPGT